MMLVSGVMPIIQMLVESNNQRACSLLPFLDKRDRALKSVTQRSIKALEDIRRDMPNFSEVVDFISLEMRAAHAMLYRSLRCHRCC